jgi:hypothetical protein
MKEIQSSRATECSKTLCRFGGGGGDDDDDDDDDDHRHHKKQLVQCKI